MKSTHAVRLKVHHAILILGLALVTVMFQNCAPAKFRGSSSTSGSGTEVTLGCKDLNNCVVNNPGSQYANIPLGNTIPTSTNTCTPTLSNTNLDIKTLFVVDVSGSNEKSPGTDVGRVFRTRAIDGYFDLYRTKSNFDWGFITFNDSAAARISSGGYASVNGSNSSMANALNDFSDNAADDGGKTNYQEAISKARDGLIKDSLRNANTRYVIVFISDGMPNSGYASADGELTVAGVDAMLTDVKNLAAKYPGQLSFNTVYYGPNDPGASLLLQKMAAVGKGRFLDINANPQGANFPITDLVAVSGSSCSAE